MPILLIDDDRALLDSLALAVEDAGYEVDTAPDGHQGWQRLMQGSHRLVVSDVNMPGMDGFTLCRKARASNFTLPIILLTARDNEIDEALGLELGADDYVSKPFSTRVLIARIAALLRREAHRAATEEVRPTVQISGLALDPARMEVRYREQLIETTVTEFRMLEAMASRPGIVLSRQRLLELTRDDDSVVVERLVDTYVRRLRRKLEAIDGEFAHIETVIGAGYRWRDPRG